MLTSNVGGFEPTTEAGLDDLPVAPKKREGLRPRKKDSDFHQRHQACLRYDAVGSWAKRLKLSLPTPPSAQHKPSRLDGKVVPFPPGAESINDLALLKGALKDMTGHMGVIIRRIQQLKSGKQMMKKRNSWELI